MSKKNFEPLNEFSGRVFLKQEVVLCYGHAYSILKDSTSV